MSDSLNTASGIVNVGVVGIMVVGAGGVTNTKDQRFINCFTERVINPYTQKTTLYLVKRPGFASLMTPATGDIGNDIIVWTGRSSKVISSFGATNSTIYDSTTSKGAITGKTTGLTETDVGGVATIAISSGDNTAWYHDTTVATKITDVDFPGNAGKTLAGTFAHMDGYAFIMDTNGVIWNSDINTLVNWTSTNAVQANSYPDIGICCVRQRDKIMAFGTESVQFFYNAGNAAGSILSRIEPMTLKVGCVGYEAVAQISDSVFWAGSSAQGGLSIHSFKDSYQKISTPEIDAVLIIAGASNITMSSTKLYGRSFVIVNASSVTFVYCVEENAWHEWKSTIPLWHRCAGVSAGGSQVTYAISKTSTSGKVFTINPAALTFQDNGDAYTATIQTSRIGEGNRITFWEEVGIIGDIADSTSTLTIAYSDDDYATTTVLGTVDLSDPRPRIDRAGSAYRRAWILSHSANLPLRIEALAGRKAVGS
jgi:hypothetical protein